MSVASVTGRAFARAGLLGNPADGYGAKAIAISIRNFSATVTIEPSDRLRFVAGPSDLISFQDLREAERTLARFGCEDGIRLLRAALRRFMAHCSERGIVGRDSRAATDLSGAITGLEHLAADDARLRFAIRYETDIPRQVGLSGSSAIVVSALRALMAWFDVTIDAASLVELALAAEVEDLRLAGGAMDRVIQVYQGAMLMDLGEPRTAASYTRLDPAMLPPLFVAWDPRRGQTSNVVHGALRARWEAGDREIRDYLSEFRPLADEGVAALQRGDVSAFRALMTRNYEMRSRFFPISERDRRMVEIARKHGGVGKLAGSGGAIVGALPHPDEFAALLEAYADAGFESLQPIITPG